jgi:hypothetical protein
VTNILKLRCNLGILKRPYGRSHLSLMTFELLDEEYVKIKLGEASQVAKKDRASTKGLFSCEKFLLQVHGCFQ